MRQVRKTYSGCVDLPLFNFIKIVVYDELKWLYCSESGGKDADLPAIWADIFNEYTRLSKDHNSLNAIQLVASISFMNNKIEVIHRAVHFLGISYNEDLCNMLRKMSFRFQFTPESLSNDLKLVLSSTKTLILKRDDLAKELAEINASNTKVSESDYYTILAQLSKHFSFHLDPKEISVMQYLKYIESFKADLKQSQHG